jgi:hypothetical protein
VAPDAVFCLLRECQWPELCWSEGLGGASPFYPNFGVNDTTLRLSIDDDGDGGADPALGSGIIGLIDRVDAMGGKLTLRNPLGEGTSLVIELPLEPAGELNGCGCAHLHLCRWLGISTREVLD